MAGTVVVSGARPCGRGPAVADARLAGFWSVTYKVTSLTAIDWTGAKTWSDVWIVDPVCPSGACDVTQFGEYEGNAFQASLVRVGAVYAGKAPFNDYFQCGDWHRTE